MVLDITDQNFEDEVLESNLPVVVDFWAPRCGPCRMTAPLAEKLSKEYEGSLKFCKVNVDENPRMARKYKVMSIPMLMFFKGGRKLYESSGAVPERIVRLKIEALLQFGFPGKPRLRRRWRISDEEAGVRLAMAAGFSTTTRKKEGRR